MEIQEIELLTDNIEETAFFYGETLGLQIINKGQDAISFQSGKSILTFIKSNNLEPKYHFAFNIPHNKLDEAIVWAKSKFNLIDNETSGIVANFESWNAKAIYFYDNNQNILEFIARFDLENATEEPFAISSIQSISEIGLVTDKPLQLAEQLIVDNNLCFFTKGTKSENFATLGNDYGLFVIVETNRNWFPTQQKAEKFFTRIKIVSDGLIREIILN